MASATTLLPTFHSTWLQFCSDLEGTFPELSEGIRQARGLDSDESLKAFRHLMRPHLMSIATRAADMFETVKEGVEVMPNVKLTAALWKEVSETTHTAIWNYLSSLALLSASESSAEEADSFWDESEFKKGMEDMMKGLKDATGTAAGTGIGGNPFGDMAGLFEKLRGMADSFGAAGAAAAGAAAAGAGIPNIKIPERLFKGHIARMAKELAEEFKPEDFGISPDMLESSDPIKIFEYLQEIFTKKPEMLMAAAQRIAKKIQTKFMRGEIKRDEIVSEIEELMKEFSENEAFTSIFGQLGELLQSSAKATGNEGSERRRQVQERLRKKAAEKEVRKSAIVPVSSRSIAETLAASEAAAASLIAEEAAEKATAAKKRGARK